MPATPLTLRPQTPADAAFLRRLFGEGRSAEMAQVDWPKAMVTAFLDDQFRLQRAHHARVHPDADFRIVEQAGRPVGRLAVAWGADTVHVIDIALRAGRQGRGLGTALLRQVIAAAGPRAVTLEVVRGARAARLYGRLGFIACGSAGAFHERMRREPGAGDTRAGNTGAGNTGAGNTRAGSAGAGESGVPEPRE